MTNNNLEYRSTYTPLFASVYVVDLRTGLAAGSAEASNMEDYWFLNRVVVLENRAPRGRGIGSNMLRRLLQSLREHGVQRLIVVPGGYGNDPKRQFAFYRKNGFRHVDDHTLVYEF